MKIIRFNAERQLTIIYLAILQKEKAKYEVLLGESGPAAPHK